MKQIKKVNELKEKFEQFISSSENRKKVAMAGIGLLGLVAVGGSAFAVSQLAPSNSEVVIEKSISMNEKKKDSQEDVQKEKIEKDSQKENTQEVKKEDKKENKENKETKVAEKKEEIKEEVKQEDVSQPVASQPVNNSNLQPSRNTVIRNNQVNQNNHTRTVARETTVQDVKDRGNTEINTKPNTTLKDPNEGKKWYPAEYKTVVVPAVIEKKWVVDYPARDNQIEVGSVYATSDGMKFSTGDELDSYLEGKALAGIRNISWSVEPLYETVHEPEEGHWEEVVITPETTRQELVREAGYY